jgi:hypothetical protein
MCHLNAGVLVVCNLVKHSVGKRLSSADMYCLSVGNTFRCAEFSSVFGKMFSCASFQNYSGSSRSRDYGNHIPSEIM